jgi:heme A synthase
MAVFRLLGRGSSIDSWSSEKIEREIKASRRLLVVLLTLFVFLGLMAIIGWMHVDTEGLFQVYFVTADMILVFLLFVYLLNRWSKLKKKLMQKRAVLHASIM